MAAISAPRQPVIDLMRNRARTLIYSTGLPPAIVAAAIAALDLIEREPRLRGAAARPRRSAFTRARRSAARRRARSCRWCSARRRRRSRPRAARGRRLPGRRHPPADGAGRTARLRFTFSAQHPDAEIDRLADIVRNAHPRQRMTATFRHRDRHRYRQDLRHRGPDPPSARRRPAGRRAQAGRERLRSGAAADQRSRRAAGGARPPGRRSDEIERIAPWRFARAAVARTSRRGAKAAPIDFDALVEFCRCAVAAHRGTLLIEGVGGIMVPLDDRHTVLDWMAALGSRCCWSPAVISAPSATR